MRTSTSFDWQVLEEKDWENAVASGVLAGSTAGEGATTTPDATNADTTSRTVHLPWFGLVGVVVAVLFLWMAYAPWSAQQVEAMPLENDADVLITAVQVEAKDGYLHFSQTDPATRGSHRLNILSPYFQFEYDPRDRGAVMAVAAQLDPWYLALRQAVGLGEPADAIKIVVTPRALTAGWQLSADSVQVPFDPAAETLLQNLRMALTTVVLTEGLAEAPVHPQWNFLVDGLRQWLQTCFDTQSGSQGDGHTPASTVLNATPPMSLADLTFTGSDWVAATWRAERIGAAESLVAHIVDVYGVERLPLLLEGLRQHDSWQTLIPALFDLSVEQFEQEWVRSGQVRQIAAQ